MLGYGCHADTSCMVLSSCVYPWIIHLTSSARVMVSLLSSSLSTLGLLHFSRLFPIFVCSLVAIISLHLCAVLYITCIKCMLSDYLYKQHNIGFGIPLSQGEN